MKITEQQALAARKHCISLHRDLGVKSLTELRAHAMTWTELNDAEKRVATTARNLMDKSGDANDDAAESLGKALDGLLAAHDAMRFEKDVRTEIGSREPRAQAETPAQLAKRPGFDTGEVQQGGDATAERAYALEPEQRFTTWAQARSHGDDAYRGLSVGQYLRSMVVGGKTDIERRALSEGSDSAGGYTVPDVLSATLIDLIRAQSVVSQAGARTVPLTSDSNQVAKLLTDPVPAWRLEAGAVAESDPTFGIINLIPRSLAVQTKLSAELMEDSLNLAVELPRILAAAMAVELDRVALLGTGTAPEPRGVANVSGIGTLALDAEIGGYGQLAKARTSVLTANAGPVSAYIMHPRDEGTLTSLSDGDGQPLRGPRVVEEIPMLTTTSIPIDGGTGSDESIIFTGNFSHMLVGIRSDIRVEVLKTSAYASNLQYTLLAHMRADIAVTHPGAFHTITGVQG